MSGSATTARITPRAAAKVRELHGQTAQTILHLFVDGRRGCCGVGYGLALATEVHDGYAVNDSDGVAVIVDPEDLVACNGATIDYIEDSRGGSFSISNPNNSSECRCGG
jgi:iron-sulfur cluster assembly accessory protein